MFNGSVDKMKATGLMQPVLMYDLNVKRSDFTMLYKFTVRLQKACQYID